MAEPFLGEIRLFSFNFAPKGWAPCNGQLLPINQNQPLFALLGTNYGGDGRVNFALPNLQGRAPVHVGEIFVGGNGGAEAVTVSSSQMPAHGHLRGSADQATSTTPVGSVLANAPRRGIAAYAQGGPAVIPSGAMSVGGGQPHNNMQPYLAVYFAIAMIGEFREPEPKLNRGE